MIHRGRLPNSGRVYGSVFHIFVGRLSITGQKQAGVAAGLPQAAVTGVTGAQATSGHDIQERGVETRSIRT